MSSYRVAIAIAVAACSAPAPQPSFDLLIRNGMIYDGTGSPPRHGDVGVRGDRIVAVGDLSRARATTAVDAGGKAVAPGFINVLSWSGESLIEDGRGISDTKQGVTLEIFGEGDSMGPIDDRLRAQIKKDQTYFGYDIDWTTLGEYLDALEHRGITPNVASFVGATTVRRYVLDQVDRAPTADELGRMQQLVRDAMHEGALGVGAALIYAPGFYAKTDELIALARAAGESGGGFVAHMRSEGNRLLESIDELLAIGRTAGVHVEAYHLKAAGESNWPKMAQAIAKISAARAAGQSVAANMYTYAAAGTGLDAAMPPWVQEGGIEAWIKRLEDPAIRARVIAEMKTRTDAWENFYLAAGSPDRVVFGAFKNETLRPLIA